ncbi:MAG: aldehyde dehydrogenase family protein, partial [Marinobacter sp.]|nr:aldehyde dehydrogenase family protein [Marinobacter sp.]
MIESPLLKKFAGYVDGQWVDAADGATFDVYNPADGECIASVSSLTAADVEQAVAAGCKALKLMQPYTVETRRRWLEEIRDVLRSNSDELGRILCMEHGKPLAEAKGEVEYAAGFFDYCSLHISALEPHTLPEKPRNCSWTVHYRPIGVAGLITPWNFPIGMIAKKLSAALAAGCPSV